MIQTAVNRIFILNRIASLNRPDLAIGAQPAPKLSRLQMLKAAWCMSRIQPSKQSPVCQLLF